MYRPSRRLRALAAVAITATAFGFASAAHADDVVVDNDVVQPGVQHSVDLTVAPGDPVSTTAQMVVDYQGSKHLAPGTPITVGLDTGPSSNFDGVSGVNVGDASGTVPATWNNTSQSFTLSSSITFTAPTAPGAYHLVIHYISTDYDCVSGTGCISAGSGDPFLINLTVATPTPNNTVPTVSFTNPPTTADEGDVKTFNVSITDPDLGDTHGFASGYPDCGTGNVLVGTPSIDQAADTGTFSCRFVDGLVPAVANTVKVRVSDSAPSTSDEVSTDVTVSNLAPVVAAPTFSTTSVDCRSNVTLNGISFSDAGVNDHDWSIDIDWGDQTAHTVLTGIGSQGDQPSAGHTYNAPGTYHATVTVKDKDLQTGSNTSGNAIEVKQVYNTDFLPPFDDSTPSKLITNTMKNGRTVPVKATIYDFCAQAYVTSPSVVTVGVKKVTAPTTNPAPDAVESYSDAGASSGNTNLLRWNADATSPTGGFWIYNLDSKALNLITNSYYRIDLYVGGVQATATDWAILQPVK